MNGKVIVSHRFLGYHQQSQGWQPVYELFLLNENKESCTLYTTPLKSGTDLVYAGCPTIERPAELVVNGTKVRQ